MRRIKVIALLLTIATLYALYQRVLSVAEAFDRHGDYAQCVQEKVISGIPRATIDRMKLCGPNPLGGL